MPAKDHIKVLLVDNQTLNREAFRALIGGWPSFEVVGESASGDEALRMVAESHPDVVLLDLDLDQGESAQTGSGALELLGNLRKSDYQPHVIVLADAEDTSRCMQAVLLGAVGVVLRDQTGSVLKKAIEKVQVGEVWLERSLTANVLREFATHTRQQQHRHH